MGRIFQFNFNMFLKKIGFIKLSFIMYLSFYFYEIKFFLKLGELYNLFFCIVLQSVLNEFYVVVDKVVYRCFVELIEGIVIQISKLCFI